MTRHCETCRFWGFLRETEPHVEIGECRRHAPVPVRGLWMSLLVRLLGPVRATRWLRARWRLTMFDDWCGEHMQKTGEGKQ